MDLIAFYTINTSTAGNEKLIICLDGIYKLLISNVVTISIFLYVFSQYFP